MIGLDTNVLVRYVMQDDPSQSPRATRLIEALQPDAPGFVPVVALVELVWVSVRRRHPPPRGWRPWRQGTAVIATAAGCTATMSFDVDAVKAAAMAMRSISASAKSAPLAL